MWTLLLTKLKCEMSMVNRYVAGIYSIRKILMGVDSMR